MICSLVQKELGKIVSNKVEWTPYFPFKKNIVAYGYMEEIDTRARDATKHSQPVY